MITISLRRHEEREKDSSGKKLIHLTPIGRERAIQYGKDISTEYFVGAHSKEVRARETLEEIAKNSRAKIKAPLEYNPLLNHVDLFANKDFYNELSSIPKYDDRINYWLQNNFKNVESFEETSGKMIQYLKNVYCQAENVLKNGLYNNLYSENVSHGPNVEAAFISLIDPTVRDIRELGGGFDFGKGFKIQIDDKKQMKLQFHNSDLNLGGLEKWNTL